MSCRRVYPHARLSCRDRPPSQMASQRLGDWCAKGIVKGLVGVVWLCLLARMISFEARQLLTIEKGLDEERYGRFCVDHVLIRIPREHLVRCILPFKGHNLLVPFGRTVAPVAKCRDCIARRKTILHPADEALGTAFECELGL